jgi:hypothetical protein
MLESLTIVVVNEGSSDTWSLYFVAPAEVFQVKVSVVDKSSEPVGGDKSIGVCGEGGMVVNFQTVDHPLAPDPFLALTRQ